MTPTFELVFFADARNLSTAADFIDVVTDAANFDDKAAYAVQMAVDEACANILEHAYDDANRGRIRLGCEIRADGLRIDLFDSGRPFDPDAVAPYDPTAPLEARGRRGMGMFYIQKLMDSVTYQFDTPQGNQLTLFKRRNP